MTSRVGQGSVARVKEGCYVVYIVLYWLLDPVYTALDEFGTGLKHVLSRLFRREFVLLYGGHKFVRFRRFSVNGEPKQTNFSPVPNCPVPCKRGLIIVAEVNSYIRCTLISKELDSVPKYRILEPT